MLENMALVVVVGRREPSSIGFRKSWSGEREGR